MRSQIINQIFWSKKLSQVWEKDASDWSKWNFSYNLLCRASSIFNAKDIAPKKKDSGRVGGREADDNMSDVNDSDKSDFEILTKSEERNRELVDLTKEQVQKGTGDISALDEMDDFDLLDASIDPTDIKSM